MGKITSDEVMWGLKELKGNNFIITQDRKKSSHFDSSVGSFRMTKNEFLKLLSKAGKLFGGCLFGVDEIRNKNIFIFKT